MAQEYALGSNGSGQLGTGHKEDVSVPKLVLVERTTSKPINHIAAGGNHTLLLSSGTLYSSGDARSGARGITLQSRRVEHVFQPVLLAESEQGLTDSSTAFCAATWEASIIVKTDKDGKANQVFTFGIGNKGELGQGEMLFRSAKPQLVKDFPPPGLEVVDLAACVSHVVTVLSNGEVYGWGSGRKGQLGEPEEFVYTPRKITGVDFPVVRTVCGREFTFLVGDSKEGRHVILGSDKWNIRTSAPGSIIGWKEIGAGWSSVLVLFENGRVLSWGRDDHGQCAPSNLPLLSGIAAGSEHYLGLTQDGNVLAWGWGEHGNCGPSTTNGDVKGKWNVVASSQYLLPGSKVYKIGAGCATSWIFVSG